MALIDGSGRLTDMRVWRDEKRCRSTAWGGRPRAAGSGDRLGEQPAEACVAARIVLLSAEGVGTMTIQRQTGKGKPTIWRWQARFMAAGVGGLLHDATRPGGKPPLTPA